MSENNGFAPFYREFEKILNVPYGEVQGQELLTQLKTWDSLAILEFMMLASSEYSSDMEPEDIAACATVDDLARATFARSQTAPGV